MSSAHGQFVWYELMTTDPKGAFAFYSEIMGWGIEDAPGPMPYQMFTNQGNPTAGLMELPAEMKENNVPPHWLGYVATDDIEASMTKAQELGGKALVPPMEVPGGGKFSVLSDPTGGALGLFQEGESRADFDKSGPGYVSWNEFMSLDFEATNGFYETLFGWSKVDEVDMGEEFGMYRMFGKSGPPLGGMMKKPAQVPGPSVWLYYVKVANMETALDQVKAKGGMVMNGPMEVPGGDHVAQCLDPQGAAFALHCAKES